ncbi:Sodium/calcium exchanger protein-domain-containing protein [Kalaharituber pfeilii]|nr:Sodium/calcium exchanger protein-domain-containing protein [Kalaharituber pfeilii]
MTYSKSVRRRFGFSVIIYVLITLLLLSSSTTHQATAKRVQRPASHDALKVELAKQPQKLSPKPGAFIVSPRGLEKRDETECREVHHAQDKCAFIREHCKDEEIGIFNYLELYFCQFARAPVVALITMALWLGILFSTLGIAASDFFCINLSTIATVLGMSESMAGVTFLAFGNGSPDVFSTFAAMKINSGSLAVGELIGAASFIVAVVTGSMAIVRPFKVARRPFLRDVTFFIVAILLGIFVLADGEIHMWECIIMVLYYISYVLFVCAWHWWTTRDRRIKLIDAQARDQYAPPGEEEAGNLEEDEDGGVGSETTGLLAPDIRLLESQEYDEFQPEEEEQEQLAYAELSNNMRVTRSRSDGGHLTTPHTIRPSLVGALEFRSVLNSLRKTQNLRSNPIHLRRYSDNPVISAIPQSFSAPGTLMHNTPVGSFHEPSETSASSRSVRPNVQRARAVSVNDADDFHRCAPQDQSNYSAYNYSAMQPNLHGITKKSTGLTVTVPSHEYLAPPGGPAPDTTTSSPASSVSPSSRVPNRPGDGLLYHTDRDSIRFAESPSLLTEASEAPLSPTGLPSSHHLSDGELLRERLLGDADSEQTLGHESSAKWKRFRYWPYSYLPPPQLLYAKLFPTLQGFWEKSYLEKFMAMTAVPSVFLLTITLPVVEEGGSKGPEPKPAVEEHPMLLEPQSPQSVAAFRGLPQSNGAAENKPDFNMPEGGWNRWLIAIQCICAPLFVTLIFFGDSPSLVKPILYSLVVGLSCLLFLLVLTSPDHAPRYHHLLCYAGFVVAISWISTIANEVVGVLKAIGIIFNISDAILGLTIFAMGNSLGDLVANITIAKLGFPVMALSACFGGPMLNILLGVGVSGIYIAILRNGQAYKVQVSSTLVISAATLLITLVILGIYVPLNKWKMSRRIGWTTITLWGVSTALNLGVEIGGLGKGLGR